MVQGLNPGPYSGKCMISSTGTLLNFLSVLFRDSKFFYSVPPSPASVTGEDILAELLHKGFEVTSIASCHMPEIEQ